MVNGGEQSTIPAVAEHDVELGRLGGGGRRLGGESSEEEEEGSQRFSDAEDRSWHSRQNSAAVEDHTSTSASARPGVGAGDGEGGGVVERDRKSCVSEGSLDDVDLEAGPAEITKASPDKDEMNCRICHLGLETGAAESGAGIVLGCSCKDDLSCAHKQCAETWFKIRGNKICEICGSAACNVVGFGDGEFIEQWNESSNSGATQAPGNETRRFWQGHRFLNFLLACMVFAFVISWLFHFNVPGKKKLKTKLVTEPEMPGGLADCWWSRGEGWCVGFVLRVVCITPSSEEGSVLFRRDLRRLHGIM